MPLTQEIVQKLFSYDKETGLLTHRVTQDCHKQGQVVGSVNSINYVSLRVFGEAYQAHSIIWLYVYGYIPAIVDHINLIRSDNRLVNLREATVSQNNWNSKTSSRSSTGVKGINFVETGGGHYLARVSAHGKRYAKTFALSLHRSEQATLDAATTWLHAKRKELHGDFANNG